MAEARSGFTLAELLVVVAIIGVLLAMILPVIGMVRTTATRIACASNQRQVGMAYLLYAQDHDGGLPACRNFGVTNAARSPAWFDRLPAYVDRAKIGTRSVFQCAGFVWDGASVFDNASPKSFKQNAYLNAAGRYRDPAGGKVSHYRLGRARHESQVVLLVDAVAGETGMGQWGHCYYSGCDNSRHPGRVNVLCLDGHSQAVVATPADGVWRNALRWADDR